MHVIDMIFFWAGARPHHPAIIQPDTVITYQGLADAIRSVCGRITELDLEREEPVAVSIENPAYQLVVTFALLRSGRIAAPIYRKLLPFLRPSGIKNVIYATEGSVQAGGKNIRFDQGWLAAGSMRKDQRPPDHRQSIINRHYPSLIFFSSGTTGAPRKHIYTSEALLERLSTTVLRENDDVSRALIMPGVSSSFGFNRACELFYGGRTTCFAPPDESSLVLISTYCIDGIFASPQQILGLGHFLGKGARYPLNSLKSVKIGGGLVSREFVRIVKGALCPKVTVVYGSTEAGVVTSSDSDTIGRAPGAVGYVLPWVELEIVDESENVLPAGEEGRIRCRTPVYLKNLAANHPQILKGSDKIWWYPGDLGHLTAEGLLCVAGRTGEVINQGGNKVSAAVLEEVLLACRGVKDAGVCGVANMGTIELWVAIVPKTTIIVSDLMAEIAANEKFNANIDQLLIVDVLPRGELGKIQRHELQQKLMRLKNL
jgi:acyl-coenzyme A synthetase/AMP-(fatty) acid ligase